MKRNNFETLNDLITVFQQGKQFFKLSKNEYKLNYEEIFILNYIYQTEDNKITAKTIAEYSGLKPYYLTKALQKLIKMDYLSKTRSDLDERAVVVNVSNEQRKRIEQTIESLQMQLQKM
ncbi:MarR family transcriptional regulator [Staphylococcus sp. HKU1]|uniref:transcriptional regulator, SarA/Rot family n=1 Tax=unclassified Staphylococcus TaxID=91994 RepID=UPI00203C8075|nr:MarR family transcriptional regulator [Staphylococcus sp. Marseille-Q6910]